MDTAIQFEGVHKTFPGQEREAIRGVSFGVPAGRLVVLLGPSGCGKTTLLKMVNRLVEPGVGRVLVGGADVLSQPVTGLRRRIGYVIQQVGLFPHMSVAENIAVVPHLLGWNRQAQRARVDSLLELVGLPQEYRRRFPRQLSGGEQQRVGLARALAADPDILLMDEPFAALDAINRARLQEELLGIQHRLHKTILFVTHDVEEALHLADHIAVLRAGKLVQYGTPWEVVTQPASRFVKELTGSEDMLRRLSLLMVRDLFEHLERPLDGPWDTRLAVRMEDDLRSVLSRLLESRHPSLPVLDGEGRLIGQVSFDDLRQVLVSSLPLSQGEG